jgi:hypothetical protein
VEMFHLKLVTVYVRITAILIIHHSIHNLWIVGQQFSI